MDLISFGGTLSIIILIALATLPIAVLIDIIISRFQDNSAKIVWALIVLLIPLFGSLAYLVIGRRKKIRL